MTSWFPSIVYLLCFATSTACALLLARSYRRSGMIISPSAVRIVGMDLARERNAAAGKDIRP